MVALHTLKFSENFTSLPVLLQSTHPSNEVSKFVHISKSQVKQERSTSRKYDFI